MKLLGVLLLFAVSALSQKEKPYYDLKDAPALFEKFIKDHHRNYKDEADREEHYQAFVKTLKDVNKFNAESSSATFGINDFSDYTPEEMKERFGFTWPENNTNN